MYSRFRSALALAALAAALTSAARADELVVCADPDNLPYSRADGSGFENRIAGLLAAKLGRALRYYWLPDRRGFLRKTLNERHCDLVIGVPADADRALTTPPYYVASYVFATRSSLGAIASLDDPRLLTLRIGVPLVGGDAGSEAPAIALAERGVITNVIGFPPFGAEPAAQRMMAALDDGTIDVALLWGPQAGYFARRCAHPVVLTRIADVGDAPTTFAIAMGVRRDDRALRDEIARALPALAQAIDRVLDDFDVPRVARSAPGARRASP
jgi:mxaJ protein